MKILILIIAICSSNLFASELYKQCDLRKGKVVKGFRCPKSKLRLPINICKFKNDYHEDQFFDGCTGPTGGYKKIFFPACIKHDLCYHHEPVSNAYNRLYCDKQMRDNMLAICDVSAKDIPRCRNWAWLMYKGVRAIGNPAYHCANYFGRY
jgi:hypothetical protein